MKHLSVFLALIGMVSGLFGAEAKMLRVPVGSLIVEEVPFKIENVSISNQGLVKVEIISENGRQFRISGLKTGITDVQLLGGGMSQVYKVTVSDDLRELLNSLKRDLDAVPELDISMNNGKLVLKGELSSIANWELKTKVAKSYGSVVLDLSTFRPTPEVMLGLQKNFEKAGFKVVRNGKDSKPGEISLTQIGEMLTIAGSVYGPEDLKKINSILASQPWLTINTANATADSHRVKAYVNVQVLPVMLQVDVVYLSINKQESDAAGIDWSQFVNNGFMGSAEMLYKLVKDRGSKTAVTSHTAGGIGTNGELAAFLSICGQNNFNRVRRAGFLTFKSNDTPEFRKMQSGGTLYLSSMGAAPGGTVISNLVEVQYGLILEVKGGLTGVDTVAIELKQELSYPSQDAAPAGTQFDLKKFTTSTSVTCKLNETVAIGGLREFLHSNTNTEALPYLRNVPGLKWLFAQEGNNYKDEQILTLVSVRILNKSSDIDPVAVELEKMKRAEDKALKAHESGIHKNDGKWYEFWRW